MTGVGGVKIGNVLERFHFILKAFELPLTFSHVFCTFNSSVLDRLNRLLSASRAHCTRLVGNHRMVLSNKYLLSWASQWANRETEGISLTSTGNWCDINGILVCSFWQCFYTDQIWSRRDKQYCNCEVIKVWIVRPERNGYIWKTTNFPPPFIKWK